MHIADTRLLVCPQTHAPLAWEGTNLELMLADGHLRAAQGGPVWPVVDGLPQLYREAELRGTDRLQRHIHDRLPAAHRPLARWGLPLLQGGGSEQGLVQAAVEQLQLATLPTPAGRPARILEVGIGTGLHLEAVRRALPQPDAVEYWGTDLSPVLLGRCRARWGTAPAREQARLLLADAHQLPFPDGTFDRVLHVGGLGRFDDPRRVLAELLRVAAPGGRVVIVAKRLDPAEEQAPAIQAAYRLLTLHEPEVPLEAPPGAVAPEVAQLSRFFAALAFGKAA